MALLVSQFGWEGTLTQLGWFLTKAALLTFGGASAVLPYVSQGAVILWRLNPVQMIDGLALGETTPGPLIMVVTFIGFIGGYTNALFSSELTFLARVTAAIVVTWFALPPSFFFVLTGGLLVKTTHGNLKFTAPLTTIIAAVVGVIFNLVMFFTYHVLWPGSFFSSFEWPATLIALAASIALFSLFYFKRNVIYVITICTVIGLIYSVF